MGRIERVAEQIRQEVGHILQEELHDPRRGFLTVIHATVSADLQHAHIAVSCLGTPQQRDEALEALTSASGYVRKLLGQRLRLRYTPDVTFHIDTSVDEQFRMQETIDQLQQKPPPHDHA
jgi:ribosome-binding factor A